MIPAEFQYASPKTVPEAVALLHANPDAKIISGGQSLIPLMRFRLATPPLLVDINNIVGLGYIRETGGYLKIGATVREDDLDNAPIVRNYPLLRETAQWIADPLVRNRATVCGNLAHADPANDHPATMLAYRAEIVAHGPKGERVIPIDQFFTGLFATTLAPDEIVTEVRIPTPPMHSGGAYVKLERKVGDFATAAVAVQLTLDANNAIQQIGIGLTNVGATPIRAKRSEDVLRGKPPTDALIAQAAQYAQEDCDPSSDLRGTVEYKRNLVRVLTMRAIKQALERARG